MQNPEKEDELQEDIDLWRIGGREVVERIFAIMPPQEQPKGSTHGPGHPGQGPYAWSGETPRGAILTYEQRDFLARAPTNDEGDPVDYEGNLLLPDVTSEEEVMKTIDSEARIAERRGERSYIPMRYTQ